MSRSSSPVPVKSHDADCGTAYRLSDSESAALKVLAGEIRTELADLESSDAIHSCGKAALYILKVRASEALQLAKDHIQNQPYRDVRACWLRLHEDASLWLAAELLCKASDGSDTATDRQKMTDDWLSDVVEVLDLGLIVSGGTLRGELYEAVFANLEPFVDTTDTNQDMDKAFQVPEPEPLRSSHLVSTAHQPSLEAFQIHLDKHTTPLLLTGIIEDWPAMQKWQDPSHLINSTLGGRRCVPIEIGETYTHADWRQEIMPFRKFFQSYLLPDQPNEIGYLGQHNLFHQLPALQREIRTPDYCFSAPPETVPASRLDMPAVPLVDEPQKNIWLGPRGTRTPLHTDPYHNIFCQVIGYKYVRLYPPDTTESVYPRGIDENGINESNTSQVEIRLDRTAHGNITVDEQEMFPRFMSQDNYREAIVGPGECLYIPAGWWHYIESLATSCSVSFWWN